MCRGDSNPIDTGSLVIPPEQMMALSKALLDEAQRLGRKFMDYLDRTGSPWHSVHELVKYLEDSNVKFKRLSPCEPWNIERGNTYCVLHPNATLMAFYIGQKFDASKGGLVLAAAHTDSPCLKLDFRHHVEAHGYNQLNVCTYGGGLWHTWLDRDLGIAGKVIVRHDDKVQEHLVHVRRPLLFIPNLAIHLQNAQERESLKLSKDKHLRPISSTKSFHTLLGGQGEPLLQCLADEIGCKVGDIMDLDICLLDSAPSTVSGIHEEFISSARLDNLASCFACAVGFADFVAQKDVTDDCITGFVCYNYEEIGSELAAGANSDVTVDWLKRIYRSLGVSMENTRNRTLVLSLDMAHGIHPNYADRHLDTHAPLMHEGIVIKRNANGRYATDLKAATLVKEIAKAVNVPTQEFRVQNDSPCGSTVGPFLSSRLLYTVADIGIPQFAMHSIREVCSLVDLLHLSKFIKGAFHNARAMDAYTTTD